MGATTQTFIEIYTDGNRRKVRATVAMSSSYATGGDTWTAANFGLGTVDEVQILSHPSGYTFEVDLTNKKIKAFRSAGFTPAGTNAAPTITITGGQAAGVAIQIDADANNAVLGKTAVTTRTGITGVQAPAFTGTAVAAAALTEVAATTDLSAVTLRVAVLGV